MISLNLVLFHPKLLICLLIYFKLKEKIFKFYNKYAIVKTRAPGAIKSGKFVYELNQTRKRCLSMKIEKTEIFSNISI